LNLTQRPQCSRELAEPAPEPEPEHSASNASSSRIAGRLYKQRGTRSVFPARVYIETFFCCMWPIHMRPRHSARSLRSCKVADITLSARDFPSYLGSRHHDDQIVPSRLGTLVSSEFELVKDARLKICEGPPLEVVGIARQTGIRDSTRTPALPLCAVQTDGAKGLAPMPASARTFSKLVRQDLAGAPGKLAAVIRPDALAPVPVAAGFRGQ
jgi:hypothetical protein